MTTSTIAQLLVEYNRALAYTADLWSDLSVAEVHWRADENASAIGWHLGHQPAVAHYMVRNLTAAEPLINTELDSLMDSATPEIARGILPDLSTLGDYRDAVAERVRFRIGNIESGNVGAPAQLRVIAKTLMIAVINHEYQHSCWIGEIRSQVHDKDLPPQPTSELLTSIEGFLVVQ